MAQRAHFTGIQSTVATGLNHPKAVAADAANNLYIADTGNNQVLKVPYSGGMYGTPTVAVGGLSRPQGVAVDASGNLYICDTGNNQVLKETLSGNFYSQTAVVLDTSRNLSGATLDPQGVAVDVAGTVYISDTANHRVLKVVSTGADTYASPTIVEESLNTPIGVAVDGSGNVYIADWGNSQFYKETYSAGSYTQSNFRLVSQATAVAVDGSGNVYLSGGNKNIWKMPSSGGDGISVGSFQNFLWGVAVDAGGNMFVLDSTSGTVLKEWLSGGNNFGAVNVGNSSSSPLSLIFTFDTGGLLTPKFLTQGAPGLDFADAGSGSCNPAWPYSIGDQCTVDVSFTPKFAGTRYGAGVLTDSSGTAIATGYVYGTGLGPQVNFPPGTESTVTTTTALAWPFGVAVDGSGNLYIADSSNSRVLQETLSNGSYVESQIGSGVTNPSGVAVDGSGNVYIADTNHDRVLKETWDGTAWVQTMVDGGLSGPLGVAVDGSGNVYIADTGHNQVVEETWNASVWVPTTLVSGLSNPSAVAVDGSGNVYVADTNHDQVLKETWSGTEWVPTVVADQGTNGLTRPNGVAVDGSANVYIADTLSNRVLKETWSGSAYVQSILLGSLGDPKGVTVDAMGNVYITDSGHNRLAKLDLADAPTVTFATTPVGSTSSPQVVTVENVGNANLIVSPPGSGSNPSIDADFTLGIGGLACPVLSNTSEMSALAAGASCQFSISFAPVSSGNKPEQLTMTDNNLNVAGATQTVKLTGTAQAIISITPTSLADGIVGTSINQQIVAGGGASPYVYTVTSGTLPTGMSLSNEGVLSGTPTRAGSPSPFTITATDNNAFTGSQSYSWWIGKGTQTIGFTAASPITYGAALVTLSATGGASTSPVLFSLVSGPASVNGNTLTINGAGTVVVAANQAGDADYTAASPVEQTIIVAAATLTVTPNDVSRFYGVANPTFTGSIIGLVAGDEITATYASGAGATTPVGVYSSGAYAIASTIVDPGGKLANYRVTHNFGALTVNKAMASVTSNVATKAYGAVDPPFSGTVTGFVPEDNVTPTYSRAPGETVAGSPYLISATLIPAVLANYDVTFSTAKFTISRASASVNPTAATKAYGAADPPFRGTLNGFAVGDNVTANYSRVAGETVAGSPYATTAELSPSAALANYNVTYNPANFTITKASASVNPNSATKAYGAVDPSFSGSLTGFLAGDNVTASYSRISGETVAGGPYAIRATLTPSAALANYDVGSGMASLDITKAKPVATWAPPSPIIYGTALSATQLNASSGGVAGTFAYTPAAGAVLNAGSSQALAASFVPTDSTNYSAATVGAAIMVNKATAAAVVTSSADPVLVLNGVTLTARVSLANFMPTGIVTFLDGTTPLASATLTNGTAMLTTSSFAAGSHLISVVYSGDNNFAGTTSGVLTQVAADFTLAPTVASNGSAATVRPGGTAAFFLTFTPANVSTWPATVTLSASDLPAGATVTFSPQTLAAGTNTTAVTMTVQLAQTAALRSRDGIGRVLAPISLALLLLPFGAGLRRGGKNGRRMISLGLLAISVAATAGLSGCGTAKNSATQNPVNYTVVVTATSGALSHTTTVVLTVER